MHPLDERWRGEIGFAALENLMVLKSYFRCGAFYSSPLNSVSHNSSPGLDLFMGESSRLRRSGRRRVYVMIEFR
jgi:hypothetical protein